MTDLKSIKPAADPVIIGATGGSGTRIVAAALRDAGFFIGTNLNPPNDALEFVGFYDKWNNRIWTTPTDPLTINERAEMERDFVAALEGQLRDIPSRDTPWGWKNPRSIYLLRFFNELFPAMKFIHVVRDGRDMAFSTNQNQLKKQGDTVVGPKSPDRPKPLRAAELWNQVNVRAHQTAMEIMPDRYLLVRFEDLCAAPEETIRKVWDFAGVMDGTGLGETASHVHPPDSLGRWKDCQDDDLLKRVTAATMPGLKVFRYVE